MINAFNNNRGIALLVTLTVVTVMISVALALNRQIRTDAITGRVVGDRLALRYMAEAGIQAGMAILVIDKKESVIDSIQEHWADRDYIIEALAALNFDEGKLEIAIHDELGRIQVNALVKYPEGRQFNPPQHRLWIRFIEALSMGVELYEGLETATVVNPIKDWLDRGDDDAITGLSGAESDYYLDLDPPYSCRNGPLKHIHELELIKGITGELFNGTNEALGISYYLTVYGMTAAKDGAFTFEGKININTAELPVIAALLPVEHVDLAQAIVGYREETSEEQFLHDLSQPMWYKKVPGLQGVTIDPALLTTSSDFFRIEATAVRNKLNIKVTAVIQREKNKETGQWYCRVLSQRQGSIDPVRKKRKDEAVLPSL